jgi:hypothetical protein
VTWKQIYKQYHLQSLLKNKVLSRNLRKYIQFLCDETMNQIRWRKAEIKFYRETCHWKVYTQLLCWLICRFNVVPTKTPVRVFVDSTKILATFIWKDSNWKNWNVLQWKREWETFPKLSGLFSVPQNSHYSVSTGLHIVKWERGPRNRPGGPTDIFDRGSKAIQQMEVGAIGLAQARKGTSTNSVPRRSCLWLIEGQM